MTSQLRPEYRSLISMTYDDEPYKGIARDHPAVLDNFCPNAYNLGAGLSAFAMLWGKYDLKEYLDEEGLSKEEGLWFDDAKDFFEADGQKSLDFMWLDEKRKFFNDGSFENKFVFMAYNESKEGFSSLYRCHLTDHYFGEPCQSLLALQNILGSNGVAEVVVVLTVSLLI